MKITKLNAKLMISFIILLFISNKALAQVNNNWWSEDPSAKIIRKDTTIVMHNSVNLTSYYVNNMEGYFIYSLLEINPLINESIGSEIIKKGYRFNIEDITIEEFKDTSVFMPDAEYNNQKIFLIQLYQGGASHVQLNYQVFTVDPLQYKGNIPYRWWEHDESWFYKQLDALLER